MSGHLFSSGRSSGKWACLSCRRVAKRIWKPGAPALACAVCRAPLRYVGKYFAAPRRADSEQWRKVEALLASGFVFNHSGPRLPRPPGHRREVAEFLRERQGIAAQHREHLRREERRCEQGRRQHLAEKRRTDKLIEKQRRV